MNTDLAPLIEAYLLDQGGWVATQTICEHFAVDPRDLRSIGKVPGLCSRFAVSGMRGYIHIRHASIEDKLAMKHRVYKHALSQIRGFKVTERAWQGVTIPAFPYPIEKATGQTLLPV